jgi:DNA-binding NarL/FixJ family response regulator
MPIPASPSEFFATAVELFFEYPVDLKRECGAASTNTACSCDCEGPPHQVPFFHRPNQASREGRVGMINLVIVEDKKDIREGLVVLLGVTDSIRCVASYGNCEDMLAKLSSDSPDIILMDIGLPGMSGIEGTRKAKQILPEVVVLVLSVYDDDKNIFAALCMGACGYLVKNTPPARLIEAITEAHAGGSPMSSHIARKVVTLFQKNFAETEKADVRLTERETEILTGLADGHSYSSVADSLFISVDTVRYHIRNIYRKLEVHSQSAAVSKAIRTKLI